MSGRVAEAEAWLNPACPARRAGQPYLRATEKSGAAIRAAVAHRLDPAWLRDNCQCPSCRDPASGQRIITITDQAANVTVVQAVQAADGLHVTFGPDGHQAVFTRSWLAGYAAAEVDRRCEDAKRLWSARDFPAGPPVTSWQAYAGDDAVRLRCLRDLLSTGYMVLSGVPAEPGTVTDVVASFGYIRETSDGRVVDLVEPSAASLPASGPATGPQTDSPYRDPVPTLQILHCLASCAGGVESGLLDGFRAAAQLRAEDPAAFDLLASTPITFRYTDETTDLLATRPMIELNAAGLVRGVRYDSRAMEPLRPRSGASPAEAADQMHEFYRTYRAFAGILLRPSLTLRFMFTPGDCVVYDNTRILRSSTGFGPAGRRHLQGCYADIDAVESTATVLARSCHGKAAMVPPSPR